MLGWELPPHNSGGLGVACWQLCKSLSKKTTSIRFVIPYKASHTSDFMEISSPLNLKPTQVTSSYQSYKFTTAENTNEHLLDLFSIEEAFTDSMDISEHGSFDVIHAHDWLTFRAGLKLSTMSGKPLIAHVHSIESDRAGNNRGNPLVHEIEELGLQNADHIIAVSEFTRQKISKEYHIPLDKITVAHNSIDPDIFEDLSDSGTYKYLHTMKNNGYKVVVNVGRLTIQKGLTNFLRSAAAVVAYRPKTLFLIVGSGDQQHELIRLSAELGIGKNVLFTGFQRGQAWRDAFAVADLFVMPSVAEPFGLTPLEAAAFKTPSLISKQSGVSEVLKNCLRVDSWDEDDMAQQMIAFLRENPLARTMGDNVYAEFTQMNWAKTADILMDVYQKHVPVEVRA